MDLHNAQLLVLAMFLASGLAISDLWWTKWRWGGDSELGAEAAPAASLGWADPWMQRWAAEQEAKQAADPIIGVLLSGASASRPHVVAIDEAAQDAYREDSIWRSASYWVLHDTVCQDLDIPRLCAQCRKAASASAWTASAACGSSCHAAYIREMHRCGFVPHMADSARRDPASFRRVTRLS